VIGLIPPSARARHILGGTTDFVDLAVDVDAARDHFGGPGDAPVTLVEYAEQLGLGLDLETEEEVGVFALGAAALGAGSQTQPLGAPVQQLPRSIELVAKAAYQTLVTRGGEGSPRTP
jgi:hypothetical protein